MAGIGATGFILIILVALILFGPQKLPELGRAVGKTLGEFKKGTKEIMDPDEVKENSGVAGKGTTVTSAATEKQTSE